MTNSSCAASRHLRLAVATLLAMLSPLATAGPLGGQEKGKAARPAPVVEVRLTDHSTLKVALREERVELATRYGKLSIPVAEIRRIEFGLRLSEEEQKRIAVAVRDLGDKDYRRRQAAVADLQALREKAYPTLVQVARGKDPEAVRRAEQLLEKVREAIAPEDLEIRPFDVVYTDDSTIAGHLTAPALRVGTLAFGEQQLRLAAMRSLRAKAVEREVAAGDALTDPGTLVAFQGQLGKTFLFKVTGPMAAPGVAQMMGVYGTDVYTMDSSLAGAALHAGVVRPGQTGVVRVTILGQQQFFQGSARNGVVSANYGPWPGFRIEQRRNAGGNK